ncbi:MAG: hypothetical protein J5706_04905 [Elusimicrobiales bacterium]|nr:hypothetical protein [Elusimicrobiales bacterium]
MEIPYIPLTSSPSPARGEGSRGNSFFIQTIRKLSIDTSKPLAGISVKLYKK